MIAAKVIGSEIVAARFRTEVRAFQREMRGNMRKAANLVKADVVHEVQNRFGSRGPHKGPSGNSLGPLDRSIGVRIRATRRDLQAFIRPRARAFYGRFLERGLNVQRKGRIVKRGVKAGPFRTRNVRGKTHTFRLPRIPFLEPVAIRDASRVVAILGNSYAVFYRGGRG